MPADALFVLIGAEPHTGWLPAEISRDAGGLRPHRRRHPPRRGVAAASGGRSRLETSMPGVLAAGDVRHGSVKRVASAVGEGSIAIQTLHRILASAPQRVS